MTGPT